MKNLSVHIVMAVLLIGSFVLTVGCKPGVPSRYIQPDDMEDILYDYHVADGMAALQSVDQVVCQRAYRLAVLKKYGVTTAEFDSSLVYYMRHADRMHQIYEHLAKRMSDEAVSLGASASGADSYNTFSATGDTANIWKGETSAVFVPKPPFNQMSFSVKADSAFHRGDVILLHFRAQFIYQDGTRDGIAVLAVKFGNDSTASQVLHVTGSSSYTLQVRDDRHLGIKQVSGFLMLNRSLSPEQSTTTLQIMAISRLRLIRIHEQKGKKKEQAAADSTKVDSVSAGQGVPTESQSDGESRSVPQIPSTESSGNVGEAPLLPKEIHT